MISLFRVGLMAVFGLCVSALVAEETNSPSAPTPASKLRLPDFDDLTMHRVRVAPGSPEPSMGSGPGLVSLEAPGTSLGASVPLPGGGAPSGKGEFVAAPIPFFSPALGFGLGLGAAYLYNPPLAGSNSPPWLTGVGGFYSENGSWGGGAAHKMNWSEDQWRLLGALAYADLRYDFYGVGTGAGETGRSVPLRETAAGGLIELLRGVGHHWYVGGRYLLASVQTSVETSDLHIPPALARVPLTLDTQLSAFGLRLQHDTRDSTFYPTRGGLFDVQADFFAPTWGSDYEFQSYAVAYNHYLSLMTNHVVALRGYGRATGGNAPFFALASFGSGADLRGYTPGRYRDRMMFTAQAEYRWRFTERFGVVAFAGFGGVAPEIGEFDTLLPSIGTGLRYVLAKKNNVSLRFDAAWGRNDHAFYVGVGEAF